MRNWEFEIHESGAKLMREANTRKATFVLKFSRIQWFLKEIGIHCR